MTDLPLRAADGVELLPLLEGLAEPGAPAAPGEAFATGAVAPVVPEGEAGPVPPPASEPGNVYPVEVLGDGEPDPAAPVLAPAAAVGDGIAPLALEPGKEASVLAAPAVAVLLTGGEAVVALVVPEGGSTAGEGDAPAAPGEGDAPAELAGEGVAPAAPGEGEALAAPAGDGDAPAELAGDGDTPLAVGLGEAELPGVVAAVLPGEGELPADVPGVGDAVPALPTGDEEAFLATGPGDGEVPLADPGEAELPVPVSGEEELPADVPGEGVVAVPALPAGDGDAPLAVAPEDGDAPAAVTGEGDDAASAVPAGDGEAILALAPGEGETPAVVPGEGESVSLVPAGDGEAILALAPGEGGTLLGTPGDRDIAFELPAGDGEALLALEGVGEGEALLALAPGEAETLLKVLGEGEASVEVTGDTIPTAGEGEAPLTPGLREAELLFGVPGDGGGGDPPSEGEVFLAVIPGEGKMPAEAAGKGDAESLPEGETEVGAGDADPAEATGGVEALLALTPGERELPIPEGLAELCTPAALPFGTGEPVVLSV